ncbi:2406_t:CDS:2, partial [Dentiscutata erythropus]
GVETRIEKIHKKITELNNKIARNPHLADLSIVVAQLNSELQEELRLLTKKWQLRSKTKWMEEGEKSTKYFFEWYKSRVAQEATTKIRNPASPTSEDRIEILKFIKEQFEMLYQAVPIDLEAVEELTENLPFVSHQQNNALTKEISLQEITDTIDKLLNYKAPGLDGLMYEFCKVYRDEISPVLKTIFNNALNTDSREEWPWDSVKLKIMETSAADLTTAKATEYLRKISISCTLTQANFFSEINRKENWAWSLIRWAPNYKKNIFWRILHKALPVGTRLAYVNPTVSRDCPWCPNESQTIEHFAIECRVSSKLWELAYDMFGISQDAAPPATIEEVVTASNSWGNNTMPEPAIKYIWKIRITKEIQTALNSRLLGRKEKDFLKHVNSVNSLNI